MTRTTRVLPKVGLGLFLVLVSFGVFSFTRAGVYTHTRGVAQATTASTINFQGRLKNSSGAIVADGSYSIVFNLYNVSSGGTTQWTETQSVTVTNGYFRVYLGDVTPFPGTIDWSQEQWLTMNINADGEMNPRIKLTAVPYAFRAGSLQGSAGSYTADDLLQKAPTSIQTFSSANAGLRLNQTGAGGLIQLQGGGTDIFTISNAGVGVLSGASLTIGTSSQAGALILNDGSSNTGTLQIAALGQNTVFTLPDPGVGSAEICLSTNNCGGGDVLSDGNTDGAALTIGTNDGFDFNFETNGLTRVNIQADGDVAFDTNTLFVDAVNNKVGIGTASTSSSSDALTVNGGITLGNSSGTNTGTIRWTGSDFEGYNGTTWLSFTQGRTNTNMSLTSSVANLAGTATATATGILSFTSATEVSSTAGSNTFVAPASGSFRACTVVGNANRTAGTATLRWRVNGASVGTGVCVIDGTNVRTSSSVINPGVVTFSAGDTITVVFDSSGLVPAATTEYTVYWTVEYNSSASITNAFVNGGNSFGGTATLGTNDNNALQFETNNVTALTISSVGVSTFANAVNVSSGGLSLNGGLDNNSGGITNAGAVSGATTIAASGDINTTGGVIQTNSTTRIDNSGNLVNIGNLTASGALTIASTGSNDITLDSGSNKLVIAATDTSLERVASGTYTINLSDSGTTTLTISNSGAGVADLNLADGGLQTAGTTRITNAGALQNVTANADIITGGTLTNARGGTGLDTSAAANGTLLIGNGSGFSLASLTNSGGLTITNGAGSIGLAVNYGSGANTAVQGNTTLTCASGTGNLTGGGNTITLGSGGSCNNISTNNAVSFTTSVTTPLVTNAGLLTLSSTGANDVTLSSGSGILNLDAATIATTGSQTINLNSGAANTLTLTNTGAGTADLNIADGGLQTAGTTRLTSGGALQNISTLGLSGAISGGTSFTGSGDINTTGGVLQTNSTTRIDNSGNLVNIGNLTASGALIISSGGSSDLTLDSASNKLVIAASDTTLQRTAAGSYTVDLSDGGATSLVLSNSGAGVANINLSDGSLYVAGTQVLTNGLVLQNLTGLTVSSGGANITGGITATGAINLNNNSNNNVDINTGTSTGTITLGGGSAPLVINSTNFDVSSGGGLSGITGFTQASGNFAISGSGTFDTGTGLVSLNGNTSIASGKTFSVAGTSTLSPTGNGEVALTINGTTGTAANALVINQTRDASNIVMSNTAKTTGALISLSHSTSAFTGTGLLVNIANGSGSFASGNFLDFQINSASRFRVDNTGALEIRSGSTTGLVIKDAVGTNNIFTVNVSGNSVYLGNAAADGTGVILVFDNKNTNGDPTGQEGAEYYNSARGTFRCYEGSRGWTDCLGSTKPNTRRVMSATYPGSGAAFNVVGDIATVTANTNAVSAASSTEPTALSLLTSTTLSNVASVVGNTNYNTDRNIAYQTYIDVDATTARRVWAGLTNQTAATMGASANPAGNYVAFRYDTGAGDVAWQCVTKDNTTQSVASSGVSVDTTGDRLEIIFVSATRAIFKINGVEVCNRTANLPQANTNLRYSNSITNLTAGATRTMTVGWMYIESD